MLYVCVNVVYVYKLVTENKYHLIKIDLCAVTYKL